MKKLLAALLALSLTLSLAACAATKPAEKLPESDLTEEEIPNEPAPETPDEAAPIAPPMPGDEIPEGTTENTGSETPEGEPTEEPDMNPVETPAETPEHPTENAPAAQPEPPKSENTAQNPPAAPVTQPVTQPAAKPTTSPTTTKPAESKPVKLPALEPKVITPDGLENKTVNSLWTTFCNAISADANISTESLAAKLAASDAIEFFSDTQPIEVGADYFPGFGDYQIQGYTAAATFGPMITAIAFVGYVFELPENAHAEAFVKALTDHCNPRWNVCVGADTIAAGAVGNRVFFLMCPFARENSGEAADLVIPDVENGTLGAELWDCFAELMDQNRSAGAEEIAAQLCAANPTGMQLDTIPVEEGELNGFGEFRVTGFREGAMFAPMIGSTPLLGYVLKLNPGVNVDGFVSSLLAHADPAWNICVQADQTVCGAFGSMVFFVMCPAQN